MRKYLEFLLEQQLELISESIVYISPVLREVLNKVKHPISKALLNAEEKEIKDDITFLDYTEQEGFVTFKTMKSMLKQIDDSTLDDDVKTVLKEVESNVPRSRLYADHLASFQSDIYKKSRNPIKLGRLINAVLPGEFDSIEIAKFSDKFKSYQKDELTEIKVVEGEEIAHWYKEKNHLTKDGTLGSSCMRSVSSSFFEIYVDNPEVCKLVIVLQEDEQGEKKLSGRALLWKPSDIINGKALEFEWFMDRQYGISESEIEMLRKWATEKGYAYKTKNSHSSYGAITLGDINFNCQMEVELKKYVTEYFPYMDTFKRFNPDSYILYNDDNDSDRYNGCYILNSISGGYEEVGDNRVYSSWEDEYIDAADAVYSRPLDGYLLRSRSVYIGSGSRNNFGWYPITYDNIVFNCWRGGYLYIDDAVYSEWYDGWFLAESSIDVVDYVGKDGNCKEDSFYLHEDDEDYTHISNYDDNFWYEHLLKKEGFNWKYHDGILKSLLVKDWDRKWILKDFQIKVYNVVGEDFEMEYLDKGVFATLDRSNIQLGEEEQIWCIFEYIDEVNENFDLNLIKQKLENSSGLATATSLLKSIEIYYK
jgi:hypothetical protein